jgi:multidrug efflux pump subunit AcrB
VTLFGQNANTVKKAGLALAKELKAIPGITNINDNLPFGQTEVVYHLTPQALSVGLTTADVGHQIYNLFSGSIFQYLYEGQDEITAKVALPDNERKTMLNLHKAPIFLANGSVVPLEAVANLSIQKGFDQLKRTNNQLSLQLTAQVDPNRANTYEINQQLKNHILPKLAKQYFVQYDFLGADKDQKKTLKDMLYGMYMAIGLIYLVLAAVSKSYVWPLFVMVCIPFALAGALLGHWLLGLDITILSMFGFFGLAGIVVNDSIILLLRFKELMSELGSAKEAMIEASVQRFRAVVLTSLTTIVGLSPLLFETSLQAQFLIPMATSMIFGIATATLLILIVIPAMVHLTVNRWHQHLFENGQAKLGHDAKDASHD